LAFTRNPSDTDVSPATYTATGASDLLIIDQQRDIAVDGSDKSDVIRISAAALSSNALYDFDVRGFAGKDTINIDAALIQNSTINGNIGADTITAGVGGRNGSLNGSFILGGKDDDKLRAINISDGEVNGNLGNDLLEIAGGEASFNASIRGGQGQDTIELETGSNFQNSSIFGDKGRDKIEIFGTGNFKNTTVFGGEDNDTINVVAGAAAEGLNLEGNKGNDTIFALGAGSVTVKGGEGNDRIATGNLLGADNTANLTGGVGADSITLDVFNTEVNTVNFNSGDSIAASAVKFANIANANGQIVANDTVTFGKGIDTITGFDKTVDKFDIDFTAKGGSITNVQNLTFSSVLASDKIYELNGTFSGSSTNGSFTVNGGTDSIYIVGGGNETLANVFKNNTNMFQSDLAVNFSNFI
jgi:hypothetical protein